jgi:hypothetical protein
MSTSSKTICQGAIGRVQSVDNVDTLDNDFKSLAYNIGQSKIYRITNLLYIYKPLSTLSTIKPAKGLDTIWHCPQNCPHIVHIVHKSAINYVTVRRDAISHHLVN